MAKKKTKNKAEKSGIIQGESKKGWNKYYCKHIERVFTNKFADEQKMLLKDDIELLGIKDQTQEVVKK